MADVPFPLDLARALEQRCAAVTELSELEAQLMVAFCSRPQLCNVSRLYPRDLARLAHLPIYVGYVHWAAWALGNRAQPEPPTGESLVSMSGPVVWNPTSAGWLVCAQAGEEAGYPADPSGREVLDWFEGSGELCALSASPKAVAAALGLMPSWEGSAGALACAVRLGTA